MKSVIFSNDVPIFSYSPIGFIAIVAALTVRYLTGRFIGEYHSNTDLLYNKIIALEAGPTEVEIVDVHDGNLDNDDPHHIEFPMEQVNI